jgi:hypothetical protein
MIPNNSHNPNNQNNPPNSKAGMQQVPQSNPQSYDFEVKINEFDTDTIRATGCGVSGNVLLMFLHTPDNIVKIYNGQEWKVATKVLPVGQGDSNVNAPEPDFIPKSRLNLN